MQYAHERGVIHRDLKPGNVLIDDRDEPIVLDFGVARRAGDQPLTDSGEIIGIGTPAYMAPEQARGDIGAMGPSADVYALGAVLYLLLTGARPIEGNVRDVLNRVATEPPVPPSVRRPGLHPAFDAVCLRALAKEPGDRWPGMRELAEALAGLAGASIALTVAGTGTVYHPPPTLPIVTAGRQKRGPDDPPDRGNDLVLRVAGNDALSERISRRHFELHRTPTGWAVFDRSKGGLTRNGCALPRGAPTELADGDRLDVAGVLTLIVSIGGSDRANPAAATGPAVPPNGAD
jgi:serine/threonine protein kinase